MRKNLKNAFTLTEILIAVTIIGTIAALTIPTFLASSTNQNTQYVAGLKKVYSEFNYATQQIMANNSNSLKGLFSTSDAMVNQYCKYMKCSQICTAGNTVSGGCFNAQASMKMLNSQAFNFDPTQNTVSGFMLVDGSLVYVWAPSGQTGACTYSSNGLTTICGTITIDVNGFKAPNIMGRDIFNFWVLSAPPVGNAINTGIFPEGSIDNLTNYTTYCGPASADPTDGVACSGRVFNESKMLY